MHTKQKIALFAVAGAAIFVAGSSAQTTTMPAVDLSVGPLAVTTQAVNVALALSVEFPTAGAAYRSGTYDHAQEYLGYWDPKGCYQYGDASDPSTLAGNYFRRVGPVDSNKYCAGGASYSGNVLNYAATSSIDLLRYALTGGNRVLDTANQTVLGRAFLPTNFNGIRNSSYFPQKQVSSDLVGKVTPQFTTPGSSTNYTGAVYFNSCEDLLLVGNASSGGSCAAPGNTNAFGPVIADTSGNYTEKSFVSPPANTSTIAYVLDPAGKKEWRRTQPEATTTVMPSGSDPNAGTLVPEAVSPTPRNTSVIIGTGPTKQQPSDTPAGYTYTAVIGSTVDNSPTDGSPVTSVSAWEELSKQSGKDYEGLFIELNATNWGENGAAGTVASSSKKVTICRRNSDRVDIKIKSNSTPGGAGNCPSNTTEKKNVNVTTYRLYKQVNKFQEYTKIPFYNYYQEIPTWYQMSLYTFYREYGVNQVRMKANVQVCDSTEASTRQDSDGVKLCKRYPDDTAGSGNYKPVGELQRKSEGVRVAAFGYAMEDGNGRYGGVLRAPMKFLGDKYRDTSGTLQSNAQTEWDANTGVFTSNPLSDSAYGTSGAINYLNKFGTAGKYKSNDPVGELYYEALRYFQGLQPTSTATSSLTTTGYDNFPIYTSWTDPIQNSCQRRNFILTIGDVNSHYDKQLPGHKSPNGVNETSTDPARAAETIPGSAGKFNVVDWTKLLTGFETGTDVSYTDALGRVQNTLGNPNTVAGNTTLDTKATGSTSSAYYWAGAAYWANTQPIRMDTKTVDGREQSMKDIRVKTFTIDVDEGGNGSIDSNTRAIKPRNSSFFLVGKYGWFTDANEDGNPFKTSGGSTSNKEWEDSTAPTVPDGYVLASQAQRMIEGIRKFFGAVSAQSGTVSASAVSSQRFTARSPNGDFYSPSFNSGDWSGTVIKSALKLNTTTNAVESLSTVVWDAGQILTAGSLLTASDTSADPYLKPVERKIFTYRREGSSPAIAFTSANLAEFDTAMRNALNRSPVDNSTDNLGSERVDYLRGVRTQENATTNPLRRRASVMGDIINSGPVFKKEADANLAGDSDYPAFSQSTTSRTAVVYFGANDGMLHAMRASDGKELFAYVPLAVAANLNRLTHKSYQHTPYADGVPRVGEAKIGTKWRTVLASGMGGGAQGVFVLDVTDPDHFEDGSTDQSKVLFEFTDQDDPRMGNILTQPQLLKVKIPASTAGGAPAYQWFVAVSSGYNNYVNDGTGRYQSDGSQAIFFLSLNKAAGAAWTEGTNYFKITVPASTNSAANGLANPGVLLGSQGEVKFLYAGDLQGNVWKFDLSEGLSTKNISDGKILRGGTKPMFTATAPAGTRQPITTPPLIANNGRGAYMVVVGTGKFMESNDPNTTDIQSIYGLWDDDGTANSDFELNRNSLAVNVVSLGSSAITIAPPSTPYTLGRDTGNKRGWYFDLAATRERIAVEGAQGFSSITFNSTIPTGDCSGDGDGRSYTLNPLTGVHVTPIDLGTGGGLLGIPIYLSVEVDDGNYSVRYTSGSRNFTSSERVISPTTKLIGSNNIAKVKSSPLLQDTVRAGRVSWREVRDFKD